MILSRQYYSLDEVSTILQVEVTTLRFWMNNGYINKPKKKNSRKLFINHKEFLYYASFVYLVIHLNFKIEVASKLMKIMWIFNRLIK